MPKSRSNPIKKQIAATRRSLKALDGSLRRLVSMVPTGARDSTGRRPTLSATARASLVLQGRYMGYMRHLRPKEKARVRKIRETKGVRAAIVKARLMTAG